jgi:hypothetical protein
VRFPLGFLLFTFALFSSFVSPTQTNNVQTSIKIYAPFGSLLFEGAFFGAPRPLLFLFKEVRRKGAQTWRNERRVYAVKKKAYLQLSSASIADGNVVLEPICLQFSSYCKQPVSPPKFLAKMIFTARSLCNLVLCNLAF